MRTIQRLLRQPAAPLLAIVTLALGLGISTALFTVTRDVVLRPFPFREQERIVAIWSNIPEQSVPHLELTLADYDTISAKSKTLEHVSVFSAANFAVIANMPQPVNVKANFVTKSFYPLLDVRALHGRVFSEAEHKPGGPPVALISHRLWTSLFGAKKEIVGKPIDLEGDKFTVVGVLPPELNFPSDADLILPLEPSYNPPPEARHNSVLEGVARMKPGVTFEQAQAELNVLADQIERAWPDQYKGTEKHALLLVDEILGTTRPAMTTLFVMALLVLAIATLNAAGIFIARAVARQRDTAIRLALGATRGALLREVLAETMAVAMVATVIGFVLAKLAVALLVRVGPSSIPRLQQVSVSLGTYAFAAAMAIIVAIVCALFASIRTGGSESLRDRLDRGNAALRSRRLLSIVAGVQLGVAFVLLVGAALMIRSFLTIAHIDAGFSREHVLTAHLPLPGAAYGEAAKRRQFFTNVVERMRSSPGIATAGATLIRPLELELGWDWTHTVEGQEAAAQKSNPLGNLVSVTPGYLEAMGIPLLRGRLFDSRDHDKADKVTIVGRAFALRYFGTVDVIGKRVKAGKLDSKQPWLKIVGVVGDVRYRGLTTEKLDVYHPYLQSGWTPQYVALRTTGTPAAAEATLRAVVRELDPNVPVSSVRSSAELIDAKLAQPRLSAWVLGTFAAVALLLSIIGVYAVLSYAVRNRTTEMGVRLALGARSGDLLRLVVRHALLVSITATTCGALAAIFLTRFLGSFLYGVSRAEPITLALAGMIVILAAILGSAVPAWSAARTDPMVALRDE
ncbi:MAG TPA: ABC transporter permease [Thermoanaerobaculia bacterium]|jgi:predicted permease|nr:ABC transporter permease [Thermoanaerobaculia bacterium]